MYFFCNNLTQQLSSTLRAELLNVFLPYDFISHITLVANMQTGVTAIGGQTFPSCSCVCTGWSVFHLLQPQTLCSCWSCESLTLT